MTVKPLAPAADLLPKQALYQAEPRPEPRIARVLDASEALHNSVKCERIVNIATDCVTTTTQRAERPFMASSQSMRYYALQGLYRRNRIWYARLSIDGRDYRFSLRTASEAEARLRLDDARDRAFERAGRHAKTIAQPAPLTVNAKGNIGLLKVAADLAGNGFDVYLPISGASPVDLIAADFQQRLRRVQVKYRSADEHGRLVVPLHSVVNGERVPINLARIDGWAIYCPASDDVYYLPKFMLRARETKQFQLSLTRERGARAAEDYRDPARFWR